MSAGRRRFRGDELYDVPLRIADTEACVKAEDPHWAS
jgi:hypothetical protein